MAVLSAIVAAIALGAPPAVAQQAPATVAGPLPEGSSLVAFDRGGRLCLQVRAPGAQEPAECNAVPDAARHAVFESASPTPGAVRYAAVPADVAAVELRFATGERVAGATTAGAAYRGRFAGRVRFAFVASRTDELPYLIRLLGADGRVVAAIGNRFAPAPVLVPPATFATGRAGGARWRARAFVQLQQRETPLEPDRLERVTCVGLGPFRAVTFGPSALRAQACADEGPLQSAVVSASAGACQAAGVAVAGFISPRVARLAAVLGDGRRRPIAVQALPAAFGPGRRAFAFAAGRDTAIRRLEARDARGRLVERVALRLAPGRLECGEPDNAAFGIFLERTGTPGAELPPPPGPPRLLVADDGVRLCFSIGRFAPDGGDCGLPPVELFESRVVRQTTPAGTLVAGVLPVEVARVRVRLSGGTAIALATTPTVPGYAGRYAGAVRFFALPLARPRRVVGVDLLNAGGRVLVALPGPDLAFPPAVTVLRAGGVSVRATGFLRLPCISVGTEPCGPTFAGILGVTAPCAPRRIVVTAILDARSTGLEVRLRDGRSVRARVVRLPAVAGRGRLAVAVLPAAAAPVRLVLRRGRSRAPLSRPFALPPAARQCGYIGLTGSLERAGPLR